MATESSVAIRLKHAVRDIIVSTASLSALTPRTHLAAPTTIGGNTMSVTPVSNADGSSAFRLGMRLAFYDDLGERTLTIQNVSTDGATITVATSPLLGFTGFVAAHTTNTLVYANIVPTLGPFALASSLSDGYPMVAITATEGLYGGSQDVPQWTWPVYQLHVQTSRLLYRPGDQTVEVDPELWNDQQEDLTIRDIESIGKTLLLNQELITDFAAGDGMQFGKIGGNGEKIRITHGPRNIENTSDWHYIGTAQILVTTSGVSQA